MPSPAIPQSSRPHPNLLFLLFLLPISLFILLQINGSATAATTGLWSTTGSMATVRYNHTATLLPNGKVLVTGGFNYNPPYSYYQSSAEIYDPATGLWSATSNMASQRTQHTATLLPNGKVLVTGGWNGGLINSAEIYDPATGLWFTTGSMATARDSHTATLLPNGQVLVVGGSTGSPELYDPATSLWSIVGRIYTGVYAHTATLLQNGKVLVVSGSTSSAITYDPASGLWSTTGSMVIARDGHSATLLPNGKVLVAGGIANNNYLASVEIYDPATDLWSATSNMASQRTQHTATLLQNGKVLVMGGWNGGLLYSTEIYDPATGLWSTTGGMATARDSHTATLLQNGQVLVTGGRNNNNASLATNTVELYTDSTDIKLTISPDFLPFEDSTTFTAILNPLFATGTISFTVNNTDSYTATITAGIATYSYQPTAAGLYTITATYPGDNNYPPATSSPQFLTVYNTLIVNNNSDDPNTSGTLPYALQHITAPGVISLTFSSPTTITLSTGVTLNPNISLLNANNCTNLVTIYSNSTPGDGLTLKGNNYLTGLWIKGYEGRQLVVPLPHIGKATLKCVKISKT